MGDPEFYLNFHAKLNEMRRAGDMCDVKIISRDNDTGKANEFMAHMIVLSAASPHFKRVFHSDFKEAIVGEVTLDMDSDIVEFLLEYMYTSKAKIDESIAARLLPEAAYLQLDTLKERCAKFLLSSVTPSNCIEMWSYARLYTCQEMKDLAWNMMCRNFDSLIDTPEFIGLDEKDLLALLAAKSLRCRESSVFSGVCNWVRADPGSRKQHMKELFSLVRLSCLKKDYLVGTVGKEPLITEDKQCLQMYHDCLEDIVVRGPRPCRNRGMNWKASGEWTDGPQLGVNMNDCSTVVFDDKIYSVSYDNHVAVLSQGSWHQFASPTYGVYWNLCVVADSMYAIGDVSGNRIVYQFEKGSETWTLVHSAQGKKGSIIDVTAFNDRICVADGRTKIIEAFDPKDAVSGFVRLCAFPPSLIEFSLCAVDGCLMTIGGLMGSDYTNQVFEWNAQTNSWKSGSSLGEARGYLGATEWDGRLVIAGGYNGELKRDVQMLVDGEWMPLPSLQRVRYCCGLAVLDNVLYAIGGSTTPTSVEMLRFEEE